MNTTTNGGPAFPCDNIIGRDIFGQMQGSEISSAGMTMRDYFMAHAPAEPQQWFKPVMAVTCPAPHFVSDDGKRDYGFDARAAEKAVGDNFIDITLATRDDWTNESWKQRYVQWPAAWADEMLKARSV